MNGRKAFEMAHVFHIGMGGSRVKGRGLGCNCPENKIRITPYMHDIFDRRVSNKAVEKVYESIKPYYKERGYTISQIYKIAFGRVYGLERRILKAIEHYLLRRRGKTECSKWQTLD